MSKTAAFIHSSISVESNGSHEGIETYRTEI